MAKSATQASSKQSQITIPIGLSELLDFETGYVPSRPELDLTAKCRNAVKRLALTLEIEEATLSDGSPVRNSIPKTIVWLLEKFADAIES